ncbi:MAG: helix-turn-helix transcriptional regulator [Oligoflexia bacterium]|nr:helix-turn-helix transcriptional regulator [Oligoflexia bacterium]
MKKGIDKAKEINGLFLVHQNIPKRKLAAHAHDDHHLFIPLQGNIKINLEKGEELSASPGKMIYIPPKVVHQFDSSKEKGERIICNIPKKIWNKYIKQSTQEALVLSQNQMIKEILFHLIEIENEKYATQYIEVLAIRLYEAIQEHNDVINKSVEKLFSNASDDRLIKAMKVIRKDLSVSLSLVSKDSGMSSRTMNRLFSEELGVTPKEFQSLLRVERAKSLLANKKLSNLEVALDCGYSSYSQFFSQFKKMTGKIPSDF